MIVEKSSQLFKEFDGFSGGLAGLVGLGELCPPASNGSIQQIFPDGKCHPVFDGSQYSDPAGELARRNALFAIHPIADAIAWADFVNIDAHPNDPNWHYTGTIAAPINPISASDYQTAQQTTQAMIDANKTAQTILTNASNPSVPADIKNAMGTGLPTGSSILASLSSVPMWVWLAGGGGLLLLAVGGRGR